MFIHQTDKYSKFDDRGVPTHDIEGKVLSKLEIKKLNKIYEEQKKPYESYRKQVTNEAIEINGKNVHKSY